MTGRREKTGGQAPQALTEALADAASPESAP